MADIILRIYDYMRRHTPMCVTTLCVSTALLILLVSRVRFNEDISAFLPLMIFRSRPKRRLLPILKKNRSFPDLLYNICPLRNVKDNRKLKSEQILTIWP